MTSAIIDHCRVFALALATTSIASVILYRKAANWGLVDIPNSRKVHALPTPRTGGLAMVVGSAMALILAWSWGWTSFPSFPWQTWVAGLGFAVVGALDDRFGYQPRQKFPVFLALSAVAAWPWRTPIDQLAQIAPVWMPVPVLSIFGFILLTIWFMAVPNAMNIEDAINGYMGGYAFIVLLGLSLTGLDGWLPLGALASFLFFNWPRAKHFMGDAGSFGCGFLVAEALLRAGALNNPLLPLALTAAISLDVAMGLVRRHRLKMGFFQADNRTFPHHVLILFKGRPLLATPILWLNVLGFVFLWNHQSWLIFQTTIYLGALVYFNRSFLLAPKIHAE